MSAVVQSPPPLSREELCSELSACWEHFRRCLRALKGDMSAEPVVLTPPAGSDSDDLELFYACREKGGAHE